LLTTYFDDTQHIYATYSDSTSNKEVNGRSQCYSTVKNSQTTLQKSSFITWSFPGEIPTTD